MSEPKHTLECWMISEPIAQFPRKDMDRDKSALRKAWEVEEANFIKDYREGMAAIIGTPMTKNGDGKWVYPNIGQPEGAGPGPARAYEYDEACRLLTELRTELAAVKAERDRLYYDNEKMLYERNAARADEKGHHADNIKRELALREEIDFLTRELRRHDPRLVEARERNKR